MLIIVQRRPIITASARHDVSQHGSLIRSPSLDDAFQGLFAKTCRAVQHCRIIDLCICRSSVLIRVISIPILF